MFVEISIFLFWVIIIIVLILVILLYSRKISINNLASQIMFFNSNNNIVNQGWMGMNNATSNIIQAQYIIINKSKISNISVQAEKEPGPGGFYEFIVQKNGKDTKLLSTISNNNKKNNNDAISVIFEAGDLISITTNNVSNSNSIATASIKLTSIIN